MVYYRNYDANKCVLSELSKKYTSIIEEIMLFKHQKSASLYDKIAQKNDVSDGSLIIKKEENKNGDMIAMDKDEVAVIQSMSNDSSVIIKEEFIENESMIDDDDDEVTGSENEQTQNTEHAPYTASKNLLCRYSDCEDKKVFYDHDSFKMHMLLDHGVVKPYKCNICGLSYGLKKCLIAHILKIHQKKINYKCNECGKGFYSKTHWKDHCRMHKGIRYKCNQCDLSFGTKPGFLVHIERIHQKKINYRCDQCGKGFYNKTVWTDHCRVHKGIKYECEECYKSFAHRSNYKRHVRSVHQKIRNYECDKCGKRFYEKCNLDQHYRIHTGERPFHCMECGKSFVQKGNMKKHQRIHCGEKPFECSKCHKRFSDCSNRNRHQKKCNKNS